MSIYSRVNGNKPKLNRFDLSYTNTFSADFGYLYVAQCDEAVPGDVWKMSSYVHTELQPMVAPVMSDIQMLVHTFFIPYRILYGVDQSTGQNIWEMFVTGGEDGSYDVPLPAWSPDWSSVGFSSKKIWDYVGNPVSYDSQTSTWRPLVPNGLNVSLAPKRAYNLVYNSFYRDEFLVDEVDIDNEDLLLVSFKKDYFTSAALSQQVGDVPAFPVSFSYNEPSLTPLPPRLDGQFVDSSGLSFKPSDYGLNPLVGLKCGYFDSSEPLDYRTSVGRRYEVGNQMSNYYEIDEISNLSLKSGGNQLGSPFSGDLNMRQSDSSSPPPTDPSLRVRPFFDDGGGVLKTNYPLFSQVPQYQVSPLNLQINNAFNVNDMRLIFAIQRLQELNSRAGVRYTEWLQAHYNVFPRDDRLQRPEYIGGALFNVTVSTNVQSSSTDVSSAQGNKVGIGQIDSVQKIGNYRVKEQGLIMTLCSFRPKPIYQQGINRQWLRQVKEDYYIPEFAYLSEQGIYNSELYVDGSADDKGIFGYQAHWNELRSKNNINSGAVREQFNYWTLSRRFDSRPHLNKDFIEIVPSDFKQVFAVQDEDPFIVSFSNLLDVYRPIPADGVPGLIDHVYGGF